MPLGMRSNRKRKWCVTATIIGPLMSNLPEQLQESLAGLPAGFEFQVSLIWARQSNCSAIIALKL